MEHAGLGDLMHRRLLLLVTALGEGGTGLLLLVWPDLPLWWLLGVDGALPETFVTARIAGVALMAIGVNCWLDREENVSRSRHGLLTAVFIYDVGAAGLLAYAGSGLGMTGVLLWPAVVLHGSLAVWSTACLWAEHHCSTKRGTT
jgi:hypothetical protein